MHILMKEELTIAQHRVITMQYSLCNTDGVIIREASGEPVSYLHGTGALPARLEQDWRTTGLVTSLLPGCCQMTPLENATPTWSMKYR